jgi:hypothetical protein
MMDAIKDGRVIEAIATARAMLNPAVDAGLFGGGNRLKRFLLKFRMTSLDHDGDSWDETAFRYDDTRAEPVIAKGASGDIEADALLTAIAIGRLPERLPPKLAGYVAERLRGHNRAARGRPRKHIDRDVFIHQAVEAVRKCGFDATRNAASEPDSACSIAMAALQELGVLMNEANVVRVYREVQHRIPAVIGKSG